MTQLLTVPFLTQVDSRAAVKGSRDPLGLQAIWSRFGRHVVGNLTTVSTSLRDFTVTMVGYYLLERAREEGLPEAGLELFLKWEQLAAYTRAIVLPDAPFRGSERALRNLQERRKLILSARPEHQILGDQRNYGLWGLYSVPARASGLVATEPFGLAPAARGFVEQHYRPILDQAGKLFGKDLAHLLQPGEVPLDLRSAGPGQRLVQTLAALLAPDLSEAERAFYRDQLAYGGAQDPTLGLQRELVERLVPMLEMRDFRFQPATMRELIRTARQDDPASQLAMRLDRIDRCEAVLAPASALFGFMLHQDGQTIDHVAGLLREQWGPGVARLAAAPLPDLAAEICLATHDPASGSQWVRVGESLAQGAYAEASQLLLERNRAVMQARGGAAPWISLEGSTLNVRFREGGALPTRQELPELWRHTYFLDALRAIALLLNGGAT